MTLKEKATRFLNDKAPDLLEMLKTTELTKDERLDFVEAFQFERAGYHPVCGMTKVCFVFDEFVIKTSFNYKVMYPFINGVVTKKVVELEDACETEFLAYRKAVEAGLGDFFFETDYLGCGIYVQERCEESLQDARYFRDDSDSTTKEYSEYERECAIDALVESIPEEEADEDIDEYTTVGDSVRYIDSYLKEDCVTNFLQTYDSGSMVKLAKFLFNYDITDIHDANVGFDKVGRLRIFDFSGFCSSTRELVKGVKA